MPESPQDAEALPARPRLWGEDPAGSHSPAPLVLPVTLRVDGTAPLVLSADTAVPPPPPGPLVLSADSAVPPPAPEPSS
jgi:hypothetical protein